MDDDKIYQRVLEIQKNIESADPKQQGAMFGELLEIVSQIEQSLAEVRLNIGEIETQINKEDKL